MKSAEGSGGGAPAEAALEEGAVRDLAERLRDEAVAGFHADVRILVYLALDA